jgi:hypothetical protein
MVSTEAVQIAQALEPEDGWFKGDAEDAIADAADAMLEAGMHPHHIEELLGPVVGAVRAEYGE